jgi:hypothetical protein
MMRVVLSTPLVLNRLDRDTRPYNFLLCPLIDSVVGFPSGVDRERFTLIAPFTKDRGAWRSLMCVNVCDGKRFTLAMEQDARASKAVPQTLEYVLRLYLRHAEAKSLAPDGSPSSGDTRGVLLRASIQVGDMLYVGKETDRRWEHGEDLSLVQFRVQEYRPAGGMVVADPSLRARLTSLAMRALMRRTGLSQHTLEATREGRHVRRMTLQRVIAALGCG